MIDTRRMRHGHETSSTLATESSRSQYGDAAHRMGPRVTAAAHATHHKLGVPVRKVPAVLHFGTRLKGCWLKERLELWHEYHHDHGRPPGFEVRAREHRAAVTRRLKPRRLTDADNQRLPDQFDGHHAKGDLLWFLDDPQVEPTNNRSERGSRLAVI